MWWPPAQVTDYVKLFLFVVGQLLQNRVRHIGPNVCCEERVGEEQSLLDTGVYAAVRRITEKYEYIVNLNGAEAYCGGLWHGLLY